MKNTLETLFTHTHLSKEEARTILIELANGHYNHSQMASFLTVFRMRNITVEELRGFRDAMLEMCISVDLSDFNTIDLCGTGGDGKNTFNISTLASFVVAGAGIQVTKHGNYGVSSACGSSNVLEYFGYQFSNDPDKLRKELEQTNFCFMHAPFFHPAMKNVASVRKDLGIMTFFNMLGPLVNPVNPDNQLIGVFNPEVARLYNYLYQTLDKNYSIVYSFDGYDEISLTGKTLVESSEGSKRVYPDYFELEICHPHSLLGGDDVLTSAKIFKDILEGQGTPQQNQVVIANAAMAIHTIYLEKSMESCVHTAEDSLLGGKALTMFNKLMELQ